MTLASSTPGPVLPTSRKEMQALGWPRADVVLFTGDAYVDHPSFGAAVVARVLEREGLRVAVVPQPNWRDDLRDFTKLGVPRLFFAVTSGNMDSMVNHYTANKRLRGNDAYTPEGRAGFRPDRALTVYTQILRRLYPETPVVIGGIEASLRRLAHYDFWEDRIRPSILADTGAHLLVYGMGERPVVEIARRLDRGDPVETLTDIPQTAFMVHGGNVGLPDDTRIELHSFEACVTDPRRFGENFVIVETESNRLESQPLVEAVSEDRVVVNPPYPPPSQEEMDGWWDLPFQRAPHPRYKGKRIPAWDMIKHSVTIHRGCFGGCSFCSISAHQGRFISSRSVASILREVDRIAAMPDFKGNLTDLGGPSANMYAMHGRKRAMCRACRRPSCIHPSICRNLDTSHGPLLELYRRVRGVPGVKRVFIGSGIRYDLFDRPVDGPTGRYLEEVMQHHVSGRLKVAPEHSEPEVLTRMRKPPFTLFLRFKAEFDRINREHSLRLQLTPYLMSSHPGCTDAHMTRLMARLHDLNLRPEQVQDFTPTPMTLSSVIFHTGIDPATGKEVFVARSKESKLTQKAFFFSKAARTKG